MQHDTDVKLSELSAKITERDILGSAYYAHMVVYIMHIW